MNYTADDLLRLARRWNNAKRTYLLVNPLQGKHIPARPSAALSMMRALGERLAEARPGLGLVIGFAETATAIGAVAAQCAGENCAYATTTREEVPGARTWLRFREEHSHAVEQKLCGDGIEAAIASGVGVALVDDELSTGRTLLGIAEQLRARYPALRGRRLAAASVINRLSGENLRRLEDAGIDCVWLLRLPEEDCAAAVAGFEIAPAADVRGRDDLPAAAVERLPGAPALPDVRRGVRMADCARRCEDAARALAAAPDLQALAGKRVTVLGTEEFMYPALLLARELEAFADVRFHATTRSPIGLCAAPGYPIENGYKLRSFYDPARETYIYDLQPRDACVVFTDAPSPGGALDDLARALCDRGCERLIAICGGGHV